MNRRSIVLAGIFSALLCSSAGAAIPAKTVASLTPPRAMNDARAASPDGHAAQSVAPQEIEKLRASITDFEEAQRREMRVRDNWIAGRFEDTDRKINEVVGRLQLFVGGLIVLLIATFVWLAELSRRVERRRQAADLKPPIATPSRSSRLG